MINQYRPWDVEWHKQNDLYFYLPEIVNVSPDSAFVETKEHGRMLMFGSYSYLGLLGHREINEAAASILQKFGTGTHGVRMLSGTLSIHNELEAKIAEFKGAEDCIVFANGYLANVSTISVLLSRHDVAICDKLDHASIIDGCRLSGADLKRFEHNNLEQLECHLKDSNNRQTILVIVDGVYSMDGDVASLPEISNLCRKYGALLMVDEAHSTGMLGDTGHGIEEYFNLPNDTVDIKMGTLSKAIPSIGGYVAGSSSLIQRLKHHARGFVYSASLPPPQAAAAKKALEIIEREPERVARLREIEAYFHSSLLTAGFNIGVTKTAITPIILGDSLTALKAMMYCVKNGVFVQAVLPPSVPAGTERLRATVTANHNKEDIDRFIEILSGYVIEREVNDESLDEIIV